MSDQDIAIYTLRRPRLLIQAARIALQDYNRTKLLKKITNTVDIPRPERAIDSLLPIEERLEDARVSGDASYSALRHVEVFTALLAEARLMAKPRLAT